MELVQKLMKKTSKYLFYSPLTEKVLTECPCISIVSFVEYDIFFLYLNLEYESTDDESIPDRGHTLEST